MPSVLSARLPKRAERQESAPADAPEKRELPAASAPEGWTVYVADVDGLLDLARVAGRVD